MLGLLYSMKSAIISVLLKCNMNATEGGEGFGGGHRPLECQGLRDHSAVGMSRGAAFEAFRAQTVAL